MSGINALHISQLNISKSWTFVFSARIDPQGLVHDKHTIYHWIIPQPKQGVLKLKHVKRGYVLIFAESVLTACSVSSGGTGLRVSWLVTLSSDHEEWEAPLGPLASFTARNLSLDVLTILYPKCGS